MIASKYSFKLVSNKKNQNTDLILKSSQDIEDYTKIDNEKRSFLKIAGIVGAGVVASQLLPKKVEALVFGSTPTSNTVNIKDVSNAKINPAKEDGNLATIVTNTGNINTNTAPFLVNNAGGYIRQDSTATIAKETGGNLATIATNLPAKGQATMAASMPVTIASNQTAIPVTGSFSVDEVGIKDAANIRISPFSEDSVVYLRRIVKLMESQATVDSGNRQRITLDSLGPGTAITTTVPVSGTVTATVSSTAITTLAGQNQQMYQDVARNAYANGIRQNLIWS